MSAIAYIAVHGGAGTHGLTHEKEVKRALRTACSAALSSIECTSASSAGGNAASGSAATPSLTMAERAICVLEDDAHLNAGYGSNLTLDGTVECDASVIAHQGGSGSAGQPPLFGSVGAVPGVKNPIKLAKCILDHSRTRDKLGRVPPLTLVSSGAHRFAQERGLETVLEEALIAPGAHAQWVKWRRRHDAANDAASVQPTLTPEGDLSGAHIASEDASAMQDTVGAVAFHWHPTNAAANSEEDGSMAAGVSSGGLLLKHPGRIGEAAVFGAGCWANRDLACSVSGSSRLASTDTVTSKSQAPDVADGTGEHIVRAGLARQVGEALKRRQRRGGEDDVDPHDVLNRLLEEFWDNCREHGEEHPAAGVILLTAERMEGCADPTVRLWCAFTTASMAVGYASSKNPKPKATIFRHPNAQEHRDGDGKRQIFITSISL